MISVANKNLIINDMLLTSISKMSLQLSIIAILKLVCSNYLRMVVNDYLSVLYVTGFAKRGLIRVIINI